jgi:hypothetical protein
MTIQDGGNAASYPTRQQIESAVMPQAVQLFIDEQHNERTTNREQ